MAVAHLERRPVDTPAGSVNGAAMAAILASAVGAFAMGLFVILHEAGIFSAPSLYAPAGALSGRSTFAVAAWLVAWGLLHARWSGKDIRPAPVFRLTLALVALGVLGTSPLVWGLF